MVELYCIQVHGKDLFFGIKPFKPGGCDPFLHFSPNQLQFIELLISWEQVFGQLLAYGTGALFFADNIVKNNGE